MSKVIENIKQANPVNPFVTIYKCLQHILLELESMSKAQKERQRTVYITPAQFQEYFGYDVESQKGMRHKGLLPYYKPFGGKVMYKLDEIERIIEAGKVESNDQIIEQTQK